MERGRDQTAREAQFDEFIASFQQIAYLDTMTKDRKLVRYIPGQVANFKRKRTLADIEQWTIEHLAAQNPQGPSELDEELIGSLGNMLLVPAS